MVLCSIHLLDGTTFEPKGIDRNSAGSAVFEKVVKHLELLETDYFGLTYRDKSGKKYWLDNSKKISKQVKGGTWVFEFQVKFYPPDPLILTEGLTRYQLCLQLRVDIFNGKLPCSFVTYALLGSYTVQSELSDYDPKELGVGTDYLSAFDFAPSQTQELLEKIAELHKHHKGQTPAEADGNFLENAKKLAMYGVDLHDVKDTDNKDIVLGVCASGIIVYKDRLRINRFVWPKILKLSYKRNNFYVKIRPGEFEPHERTIGFRLDTHKLAKRLWKTCVEHHAFFRLKMTEAPDTGTLFPRFNTRFRYSGRTQVQAKKAAEAAAREEPHITRTAERRSLVKDDKGRRKSDDVSHLNRPDANDAADRTDVNKLGAAAAANEALLDELFDRWDKDNTGYLDPDEVHALMRKYKDGLENKPIDKARKDISKKQKSPQDGLTRDEFAQFVKAATDGMIDPDSLRDFVKFLNYNVKARQDMLDQLFAKWDSDKTGYLEEAEVEAEMKKFRDGHEHKAVDKAKKDLSRKKKNPQDNRVDKREFSQFVTMSADAMHGGVETFEDLVKFLYYNIGDKQAMLDDLFRKWDSDNSGYLNNDEVEAVMKQYKGGQENKAIDKAEKDLKKKKKHPDDPRLNQQEFRELVAGAADGMHDPEAFKDFVAFLDKNAGARKRLLDDLFRKWDSNGSGYLNQDEVEAVMKQYKGGAENKPIDKASKDLKKKKQHPDDPRINRQEFRELVAGAADGMHDPNSFKDFVTFLDNNAGDRQALLDALFRKLDTDGSGYLDQDELEAVMKKYKGGQENKAIDKAKKDLHKKKKHPDDPRLNKQEFSQLVTGAADGMHGPNAFKDFVAYLDSNAGERKQLLDALFRKWDSNASGYLNQGDVEAVMKQYKGGHENKAIDKASKDLKKKKKHPDDPRLNQQEFRQLVAGAADGMHDPEAFRDFVNFLDNNAGEREKLLEALFKKWDNDGTGYLDQDEVEAVMRKYKGGHENKAIDKATKDLKKKKKHPDDPRLNQQEFCQLVTGAADGMHGPNSFKDFVQFLDSMGGSRKVALDNLFWKWDDDNTGSVDQHEVEGVMKLYKDGEENKSIEQAKLDLNMTRPDPENKYISKCEFHTFVTLSADGMKQPDQFDNFVEFLDVSVTDGTLYKVQMDFLPGMYGMAPGDSKSIDRQMQFMPVIPPAVETHKHVDEPMPFFEPAMNGDDSLERRRMPPPIAKKPRGLSGYDSEEDRIDAYKTEKDGVIETRIERKITVTSDENEEFDHDALLRAAIEQVTNMNPDLSVERIECRQIEQVHGDTAV